MSAIRTSARRARLEDLAAMSRLPKRPGRTSIGPRSLAFCHPKHSKEVLEAYFSTFSQGMFISENDGDMIGFACAVRTSERVIKEPIPWSDGTENETALVHQKEGTWLYVSRLVYTAGAGHAHLSQEIDPLLSSLQDLAAKQDLAGVAIALPFPGLRERSGTSSFQRECINTTNDQVRSGSHPIGVAHYRGFRHCLALPNYLGNYHHFALMTWDRRAD